MKETQVTLTLSQLFIADHAIRDRLKRTGITEKDKTEEEEALDAVNVGIHQILRGKRNEQNCT